MGGRETGVWVSLGVCETGTMVRLWEAGLFGSQSDRYICGSRVSLKGRETGRWVSLGGCETCTIVRRWEAGLFGSQ